MYRVRVEENIVGDDQIMFFASAQRCEEYLRWVWEFLSCEG